MRTRYLLFVALFVSACGGTDVVSYPPPDYGDLYVPTGYTLSPFLSATPVRQFETAGFGVESGKQYEVVFVTDAGRLVLDMSEADAPLAVNSMVWLARNRFYEHLAFHRVIDGFVAQSGDPNTLSSDESTWGTGDAGYEFGLEVATGRTFDGAGVLGMARGSDPGSNSSQFFITFAAQPTLNGQYTVFGNLVEGMDVLPQIVRGEPPSTPTRITVGYAVEK